VFPIFTVKSDSYPSILLPFLPIIKLFDIQLPPSAILIIVPFAGVGGSVNVKVPPDVSAII
jgi:hypothetical protein